MFYQIWDQPPMTINGKHLISDVMRLCGGSNVFAGLDQFAAHRHRGGTRRRPRVIVASGMGDARPEWLDRWQKWPQLTAVARHNLFFIPPRSCASATPRILDGAERLCAQLESARSRRPERTR